MDRFAVIGLGRFGYRLATLLAEAGAEVIAVDRRADIVEDIREHVTLAVALDCTDEHALVAQGLDKVDVAVVGVGADFESTILTTVILKQLGVPRVFSRAGNVVRGDILSRVGADALINPEQESALRWCHRLLGPNVLEHIPLAEGHSLVQVPMPAEWVGKSLADLDVRRRHGVNVVAIRHPRPAEHAAKSDEEHEAELQRPVIEMPMPQDKFEAGDVVVLIGPDEKIATLPGQ